MRTLAVLSRKGGTGKTTVALHLAMGAWLAGKKTLIADMDPQRSLVRWSDLRQEDKIPVQEISAAKLPKALDALSDNRVGLVIIDTPATESAAAEAAMKAADLCVIPSRPTVFDLWSSEVTRTRLKALGREFVFVLNQCPATPVALAVEDLQWAGPAPLALVDLVQALVSASETTKYAVTSMFSGNRHFLASDRDSPAPHRQQPVLPILAPQHQLHASRTRHRAQHLDHPRVQPLDAGLRAQRLRRRQDPKQIDRPARHRGSAGGSVGAPAGAFRRTGDGEP